MTNVRRGVEHWLKRMSESYERDLNSVLGTLQVGHEMSERGVWKLAHNLAFLHRWYGNSGAAAVLAGDQSGWETIFRSIAYEEVYLLSEYHSLRNATPEASTHPSLVRLAAVLYFWMASECVRRADFWAHRALQGLESHVYCRSTGYGLEPLALDLWSLWRKRRIPQLEFDPPLFSDCKECSRFRSVESAGSTNEVHMRKLCDVRVRHWEEQTRSPQAFLLLPLEIIVIRRLLREQCDLQCEFSHPVLESPLANLPQMEVAPDPLLRNAARRLGIRIKGMAQDLVALELV